MIFYTVYKTTNLVNGKYYFGVHKTENPDDDYLGSGTYIKRAVAKHGAQNFRKEVLFAYGDPEPAFAKEDELIQAHRGIDPLCKNLRKGGSSGFDWINRNGLSSKNTRPGGLAFVKRIASDEQLRRKKVTLILKNGQLRSQEELLKFGKLGAATWRDKHHTLSAKLRISQAQCGKMNSQFGTRWVTKNGVSRKIKGEELASHLQQGWSAGRRCQDWEVAEL